MRLFWIKYILNPAAALALRVLTWRPSRPGDTPGELEPEGDPIMPITMAGRSWRVHRSTARRWGRL